MSSVWVHGRTGRVGKILCSLIKDSESFQFAGASSSGSVEAGEVFSFSSQENIHEDLKTKCLEIWKDNTPDVIVDFSTVEGNIFLLELLKKYAEQKTKSDKMPAVLIATTGLSADLLKDWRSLAEGSEQTKILYAPNTSIGISLTLKAIASIVQDAVSSNFDIVIYETHHRYKKDSPSGTALLLAEGIKNALAQLNSKISISIEASRGGGVFGEHQIRLLGDHEEITIMHRAFSRDLFAQGALRLSGELLKRPEKAGFWTLMTMTQGC